MKKTVLTMKNINRYNLRNDRGIMHQYRTFLNKVKIWLITDAYGEELEDLWAYIKVDVPPMPEVRSKSTHIYKESMTPVGSFLMLLKEKAAWSQYEQKEFGYIIFSGRQDRPRRIKF